MLKYVVMTILVLSGFSSAKPVENLELNNTFYEFSVKTISGEEKSLSEYKGRTLLIVNTASKCGFTLHDEGLQALYARFKDKDFVVLGFPCNQFGGQEPGTSDEIEAFCQINFKVTFPMFEKIEVNGNNAIHSINI